MTPAHISRLALRGTVCSMAAAAVLWLAGLPHVAAAGWIAATLFGLAPLGISVFQSFRRKTLGVDVIALLAMAGALILGQYLAGAVIDLAYVFGILKKTGFRGYLSMEYDNSGDPYKETEELIAKTMRFLT